MSKEHVYANATTSVVFAVRGMPASAVNLIRGQVWLRSDPFVQQRPEFFDDLPTLVHGTRGSEGVAGSATPPPQRDVETGTRAPGERRTGRSRG